MTEHAPDIAALKREWLGARIVLIVGFAIAIAAGVYAGLVWRAEMRAADARAAAQIAQEQAAENAQQANADAVHKFCGVALTRAKAFGLVPSYTTLTSLSPKATQTTGRYLCEAATDSSKFSLIVDHVCADVKDPRCVELYSVTQDGKAVLYQRPN